jgi:hypothetical protein
VAFALLPTIISAACLACAAFRSQFCTDSEAIDQPPSCIGSRACALIPAWTLQRFHPDIFQGKLDFSELNEPVQGVASLRDMDLVAQVDHSQLVAGAGFRVATYADVGGWRGRAVLQDGPTVLSVRTWLNS